MLIRRFGLRVVAAALVLTVGSIPPAGAADPFDIPAVLPLTGAAAFIGQEEGQALKVVAEAVNAAGGIAGRPINFAVKDDQSNPQVSVQLLNGAFAQKPAVVMGPSFVATCSAVMPLAKDGPVSYCLSPGIHPAADTYVFSSSISTTDLLAASATYFRGRGWRRIAIITSSDATGQDAERGIDAAFNAASGVTIVDREHFNITDVSVAAQMAHIKGSNAQALIAWSTGTPAATIFRGITEAGLDIPVETTDGNATYAQMKAYAAYLPKQLYFAAPPLLAPDQVPNGPVKTRIQQYLAAFRAAGIKPDMGQALAWDPAMLVVDAYKKLGLGATATQIRDFVDGQRDWIGISGRYDFHAVPQRGLGVGNVMMSRWDASKDTWVGVSKLGGMP